jgi:glucosamine 6-phosphate synthetase-like amidotransferase/phosphosugar isomerase protein
MITPSEVGGVDSICYGEVDEDLAVFPCAALLELLAYHTALRKRLNPDRFKFIHKVTTRE